jgi:hypothetical protein
VHKIATQEDNYLAEQSGSDCNHEVVPRNETATTLVCPGGPMPHFPPSCTQASASAAPFYPAHREIVAGAAGGSSKVHKGSLRTGAVCSSVTDLHYPSGFQPLPNCRGTAGSWLN